MNVWTRVLHASSVGSAHGVAAWRTRLAIPLPSSNLRLIQALQPLVEQNQRSPPPGCCMTGPWLLQIAVDYGKLQRPSKR